MKRLVGLTRRQRYFRAAVLIVIAISATSASLMGQVSTAGAAAVPPPDSCGYPSGTAPAKTATAFNESEVLVGSASNATTIQAFYSDEHALTLGAGSPATYDSTTKHTSGT